MIFNQIFFQNHFLTSRKAKTVNVCHFHEFLGFNTSGSQKVIPKAINLKTRPNNYSKFSFGAF